MKLALIFLVLVVSLAKETNGKYAEALMYLAGTNDFIGTIGFNEQEVAWGVIISGVVSRMRPMATMVRQLLYLASPLFRRKRKNEFDTFR
jgi:hypothetical protein